MLHQLETQNITDWVFWKNECYCKGESSLIEEKYSKEKSDIQEMLFFLINTSGSWNKHVDSTHCSPDQIFLQDWFQKMRQKIWSFCCMNSGLAASLGYHFIELLKSIMLANLN